MAAKQLARIAFASKTREFIDINKESSRWNALVVVKIVSVLKNRMRAAVELIVRLGPI